jgi:hypothetical protein
MLAYLQGRHLHMMGNKEAGGGGRSKHSNIQEMAWVRKNDKGWETWDRVIAIAIATVIATASAP